MTREIAHQPQQSENSPQVHDRGHLQRKAVIRIPESKEMSTTGYPSIYQNFSQIPLNETTYVLQQMRPRSASGPSKEQSKSDDKVVCYGVSQGHYTVATIFDGLIGTSSLGSCFAVIVHSGAKVVFAHVHACSDTVLAKFTASLDLSKAMIVKGKAPGDNTNAMIEQLVKQGATVYGGTSTGAVVYDPTSKTITTPNDIEPTNKKTYRDNNTKGAGMGTDADLQGM